jgi:hypothetical protein
LFRAVSREQFLCCGRCGVEVVWSSVKKTRNSSPSRLRVRQSFRPEDVLPKWMLECRDPMVWETRMGKKRFKATLVVWIFSWTPECRHATRWDLTLAYLRTSTRYLAGPRKKRCPTEMERHALVVPRSIDRFVLPAGSEQVNFPARKPGQQDPCGSWVAVGLRGRLWLGRFKRRGAARVAGPYISGSPKNMKWKTAVY